MLTIIRDIGHYFLFVLALVLVTETDIPARWNSVLSMLESILDTQKYVNEVLKKLCPFVDNIKLLEQLHAFLTPFKEFTLLVHKCPPNLSLAPLNLSLVPLICH